MPRLPVYERNLIIQARTTHPVRMAIGVMVFQCVLAAFSGGFTEIFYPESFSMSLYPNWSSIRMAIPLGTLFLLYAIAAFSTASAGMQLVQERDRKTLEFLAASSYAPWRFALESIAGGVMRGAASLVVFLPVVAFIMTPWVSGPADVAIAVVLCLLGLTVTASAAFLAAVVYDPADPVMQKLLARGGRPATQNASSHVVGWVLLLNILPLLGGIPLASMLFDDAPIPGTTEVLPIAVLHPVFAVFSRWLVHDPAILFFGWPCPEWLLAGAAQALLAVSLASHAVLRLRRVRDDRSLAPRTIMLLEILLVSMGVAGLLWPDDVGVMKEMRRLVAAGAMTLFAMIVAGGIVGQATVKMGLRKMAGWRSMYATGPRELLETRAETAHHFAALCGLAVCPSILATLGFDGIPFRLTLAFAGLAVIHSASEVSYQQLRRWADERGIGSWIRPLGWFYVALLTFAILMPLMMIRVIGLEPHLIYGFSVWPLTAVVIALITSASDAPLTLTPALGMGVILAAIGLQVVRLVFCRIVLIVTDIRTFK